MLGCAIAPPNLQENGYYPLPITYYLLPITYYLLPITKNRSVFGFLRYPDAADIFYFQIRAG